MKKRIIPLLILIGLFEFLFSFFSLANLPLLSVPAFCLLIGCSIVVILGYCPRFILDFSKKYPNLSLLLIVIGGSIVLNIAVSIMYEFSLPYENLNTIFFILQTATLLLSVSVLLITTIIVLYRSVKHRQAE